MRSPLAYLQAIFLWTVVVILTLFSALGVLILYPFVISFDRQKHSLHVFGLMWAKAVFAASPWRLTIRGRENLIEKGKPAVYVANHLSQADILVTFALNTRFRWLAKASLFKIPFFGWAMKLIGYVAVDRGDRRSHERCMRQLAEHLKHGTPVFFFPEGTRSKDGVMKPFKSGAFRLASHAKVPVIPISFLGTDQLLPKGSLIPKNVDLELVIHPKIESIGKTADELASLAYEAIASSLPQEKRGTPMSAMQ